MILTIQGLVQTVSTIHTKNTKTTCADSEEGQRSGPPLENYRNIGFLSNTGPDPLKIKKLPIQHAIFDHHQPTSETPFKWRFTGGPLMAR